MTLRVESIMTRKVIVVSPEEPIREVARILAGAQVSGAPVVDSGGAVIGMVSESDIVRFIVVPGAPLSPLAWLEMATAIDASKERILTLSLVRAQSAKASEVMTRKLVTIAPEATVEEAASLMFRKDVNRLPVLQDGKLVGIFSRRDVLRAVGSPPGDAPKPRTKLPEPEPV